MDTSAFYACLASLPPIEDARLRPAASAFALDWVTRHGTGTWPTRDDLAEFLEPWLKRMECRCLGRLVAYMNDPRRDDDEIRPGLDALEARDSEGNSVFHTLAWLAGSPAALSSQTTTHTLVAVLEDALVLYKSTSVLGLAAILSDRNSDGQSAWDYFERCMQNVGLDHPLHSRLERLVTTPGFNSPCAETRMLSACLASLQSQSPPLSCVFALADGHR